MPKAAYKKVLMLLALCISLLLASCASPSEVKLPVIGDYDEEVATAQRYDLKLGVVTGPYGDMFMETIYPLLSQKGYSVKLVLYDSFTEPNFALDNGEIDLNMFQNYQYFSNFKFQFDMDLSAVAEIPTAPMGIYSLQYRTLEDVKNGAIVAIPDDNTNLSRALSILNAARLISLDPFVEPSKATTQDIVQNPLNLQFVTAQAQLLTQMLGTCDMAIINGNYAINSGFSLSDAIYNEILADHAYLNVIAVRTQDLGEAFVMDLIDVMNSDEFMRSITDENGEYCDFQYPCNFRRHELLR